MLNTIIAESLYFYTFDPPNFKDSLIVKYLPEVRVRHHCTFYSHSYGSISVANTDSEVWTYSFVIILYSIIYTFIVYTKVKYEKIVLLLIF